MYKIIGRHRHEVYLAFSTECLWHRITYVHLVFSEVINLKENSTLCCIILRFLIPAPESEVLCNRFPVFQHFAIAIPLLLPSRGLLLPQAAVLYRPSGGLYSK